MNYGEKLKDPRWQKRRLEIMSRDNFTCQVCGRGINDGTPLVVHHKKYDYGKEPWEYDNEDLITLCDDCHAKEHGKPTDKEKIHQRLIEQRKYFNIHIFEAFLSYYEKMSAEAVIYYSLILFKNSYTAYSFRAKPKKVAYNNSLIRRCKMAKVLEWMPWEDTKEELVKNGIIKKGFQIIPSSDIGTDNFLLARDTELRGWELLIFSYLHDKAPISEKYEDVIKELTEKMETSEASVTPILTSLIGKGYLFVNEGLIHLQR